MEKWFVAAKKADFNKWAEMFSISPVLARILRNRDLVTEQEVERFLKGSVKDCYSPFLLKDMDLAVNHLVEAMEEGSLIRVIGDYDVDGICASFILSKGLESLGGKVDVAIPHRIHDGYGLNEHLIEEANRDGIELIITCDNGIAAVGQIERAKELGIRVIVTDHHEVPFEEADGVRKEILPKALAVVDPKREECEYPFPNICGALVAYKVIAALYEQERQGNFPEELKNELLTFAAIATVCDVMELKDENRIIVKEGIKQLKNTKNLGLAALIEVNGLDVSKLNAFHLGFVIGPCLNATGRLDTAERALELLRTTTKVEAMTYARELKELNDSRKNLTLKGVEDAEKYIREKEIHKDSVMIVYLPEVHESLAGIIAGRIREKYNKPVFVLTKSEEGVKGSGRSIEAYHMYEAMTGVKELFTKYGGHKLAAGLSMREEDIEALRERMNAVCGLKEEDFVATVHIDVPMPLGYANEALAEELDRLEPYGVGNPKPLFAQKDLRFISASTFGANQNFARINVITPEGDRRQLIYFGNLEQFKDFLDEKYGKGSAEQLFTGKGEFLVSVVYQIGLNTFRGQTTLQYLMQNYC